MKKYHFSHHCKSVNDFIDSHHLKEREQYDWRLMDRCEKQISEINFVLSEYYQLYKKTYRKSNITTKLNLSLYILYIMMRSLYEKYKLSSLGYIVLHNFYNFSRFNAPTEILILNTDTISLEWYSEKIINCIAFSYKEEIINYELIDEQSNQPSRERIPCNYPYPTSFKQIGQYGDTHKVIMNCFLWTHDNKFLVCSNHSTIKYFKLSENEENPLITLMKYKAHTSSVNSLALSSSGRYFYSASNDRKVIK